MHVIKVGTEQNRGRSENRIGKALEERIQRCMKMARGRRLTGVRTTGRGDMQRKRQLVIRSQLGPVYNHPLLLSTQGFSFHPFH